MQEEGALLWFPAAAEWVSGMGVRTSKNSVQSGAQNMKSLSKLAALANSASRWLSCSLLEMEMAPQRLPCSTDRYTNSLCKLHIADQYSLDSSHQVVLPLQDPMWPTYAAKVCHPAKLNTGENL